MGRRGFPKSFLVREAGRHEAALAEHNLELVRRQLVEINRILGRDAAARESLAREREYVRRWREKRRGK